MEFQKEVKHDINLNQIFLYVYKINELLTALRCHETSCVYGTSRYVGHPPLIKTGMKWKTKISYVGYWFCILFFNLNTIDVDGEIAV